MELPFSINILLIVQSIFVKSSINYWNTCWKILLQEYIYIYIKKLEIALICTFYSAKQSRDSVCSQISGCSEIYSFEMEFAEMQGLFVAEHTRRQVACVKPLILSSEIWYREIEIIALAHQSSRSIEGYLQIIFWKSEKQDRFAVYPCRLIGGTTIGRAANHYATMRFLVRAN